MTHRFSAAPTACCAILLSLASSAFASEQGAASPPDQDCGLERIAHFIPFEPALPHDLPAAFSMEVPLGAEVVALELTKHSVRSDRFQVMVDAGRGPKPVSAPAIRTYRGTIAGRPLTTVTGSLLPTGFSGVVTLEDGTTFGVQPLQDLCPLLDATLTHATYAAADVHVDEAGCALGRPGFENERYTVGPEQGGGSLAGAANQQVEIACETDYEFFQKNGSSVANTVNDIENIILNVNTIYDRDVDIRHEISVVVIRSVSTDPYAGTTIDARLDEFDALWGTAPLSGAFRDIAHMFSGYNFSGGTIGLAYLGVICQGAGGVGYGVVESRYTTTLTFRVSLSAHELGHNWNCTHCDTDGNDNCHIMCSANGACGGLSGANLKLDTRAVTEASSYAASAGCDFTAQPALSLPFSENFDASTTLSTVKFTYNDGGAVNTAGPSEPSSPNSLVLNSTGAGEYDDDEVRTNFMLLGGLPAASVRYWVARAGVEAGKQFRVEYLNSSLDWVALNTLTSDGVAVTSYTQYEHQLPIDARHNQFRLRFRPDGADSTDQWFVDSIDVQGVAPNDNCSGAEIVTNGATAFSTLVATDSTVALPASCNDGAGIVMAKDIWFNYEATCSGTLTIETCGTTAFNSRVAVYAGVACPSSGATPLGCDDTTVGCDAGGGRVTLQTTLGSNYIIRVGSAVAGGGGIGVLTITCEQFCPTDLDGNGAVDGGDLGVLLSAWGSSGSTADLDGDGFVDGADLGVLLGTWGPCS
jgi:hypothetical protein